MSDKTMMTVSVVIGAGGTVLALLFLGGDPRAIAGLLLVGAVALAVVRRGYGGEGGGR